MTRLVVKSIWVIKYTDSCHHCPFKVLLVTCNAVFEGRDFLAALRRSKVRSKFLNLCLSSKISSGGLSVLAFYITSVCVHARACVCVCVCCLGFFSSPLPYPLNTNREPFAITGKFQKIWTRYVMTLNAKDTWFTMTSQGWYKCLSCLHLTILYISFLFQSAILPRTNFLCC
jgi:hypothetical protein